jgi:hypothetical protein
MKQHIARALLVALAFAAACGDAYKAPTNPTTSTTTAADSVPSSRY